MYFCLSAPKGDLYIYAIYIYIKQYILYINTTTSADDVKCLEMIKKTNTYKVGTFRYVVYLHHLPSHLAYVQHIRVAEKCHRNVNLLILGLVSCWWCLL